MSILYRENNFVLIDHREFISNIYKGVTDRKDSLKDVNYTIISKMFSIKNCKKYNNKRPRKSNEVIKEIPSDVKQSINNQYNLLDTSSVRDLSRTYFESTIFNHLGINGGNNSNVPLQCEVKGEYFLIPNNSRFFCGCVKEQCQKLAGNKYDIVIADPPWWNKYIRRLKGANDKLSYSMMYNEDIASIPVKELLSNNSLVVVWCTNAPSNINAVKDIIFPEWGIEYVTTWFWLKVNIDFEPLCKFGAGYEKQPYERVIIGKVGEVEDIPSDLLLMSVPSALHSHKPPLVDLLKPYLNVKEVKIIELFARYLLPNTTSIGYEPLKWQHISLYEEI
ncbi:N(6)-adenine-specific methyltransferase METTL4 [Melitaea cinxia]|uniref:N(6)-adenine-specific methyltransferase METTL4 n=1 Tax=Melitaea cinxia TaxID=113334 RepID=UPI001E2716D6|nr:N(6)-adenine-specific methyltransferase METTL4 [Melitaea cinxia]